MLVADSGVAVAMLLARWTHAPAHESHHASRSKARQPLVATHPTPVVTAPTAAPWTAWGARNKAVSDCESGSDPTANTGNGFYGKWQFDITTWQANGGYGIPSNAPESEQDRIAYKVFLIRGWQPWPVCGRLGGS